MATLTRGANVVVPTLITSYETKTESTTVLHRVIGRGPHDVSLGDDSLRSGTLHLLFENIGDAWEAWALHRTAGVWVLDEPDQPDINMSYVRVGSMTAVLEDRTRALWQLDIQYQEVESL